MALPSAQRQALQRFFRALGEERWSDAQAFLADVPRGSLPRGRNGEHPFFFALMQNAPEARPLVYAMLDHDPTLIDLRERDGRRPMHAASIGGHLDVVQRLASLGGSLTLPTIDGTTPLMEAASYDHVSLIGWLLDQAEVDPNAHNRRGQHALIVAAHHGAWDSVVRLIPVSDVNHMDQEGTTAFFSVVRQRHARTAHVLLDAGSRTCIVGKNGHPVHALHVLAHPRSGVFVNDEELLPLIDLLRHKVDAMEINEHGQTALMNAVWEEQGSLVEGLLDTPSHAEPLLNAHRIGVLKGVHLFAETWTMYRYRLSAWQFHSGHARRYELLGRLRVLDAIAVHTPVTVVQACLEDGRHPWMLQQARKALPRWCLHVETLALHSVVSDATTVPTHEPEVNQRARVRL